MGEYDIIIAGAGPAGSAAAIQIANVAPDVARRTLVVEKAVFPRHKLCAGGVTTHADTLLAQLHVDVKAPSMPIDAARFIFEDIDFTFRWKNLFRVVRREEFDTELARQARDRGVELHEGEALVDFERHADGLEVQTSLGISHTKILIGADGANSVARRIAGLVRADRISRLLEILTPVDGTRSPEFIGHTAVFDFTPIGQGLQGYYWDFPSLKQGGAVMNRGIFDSRVHPERPRVGLVSIFEQELATREVELDQVHLQGHPERWYDASARHSAPHLLLAGDAAGTEPFFGEGISHALNYGMLAATSALQALKLEDYTFRDYDRSVAWSALGRRLQIKRALAYLIYGPRGRWFYRLGFGVCRALFGN